MPVGRLVADVADKHQVNTQRSWKRPYGVGLLVSGFDKQGPKLYNTCPSGNYYECKAMAMGARSQVGGAAAVVVLVCHLMLALHIPLQCRQALQMLLHAATCCYWRQAGGVCIVSV